MISYYGPRRNTMLLLFLCLLLGGATWTSSHSGVAEAAVCKNSGKQCTAAAPWCNSAAWCSNKPLDGFLDRGCDPDASYPGSCVGQSGCRAFREDFNVSAVLANHDNFLGDMDLQPFMDEFNNAEVKDGKLILHMKYSETLKAGLVSRVTSLRYFHYGRFGARIKLSAGKGLVYSFIWKTSATRDDIGDELDYEWAGYDPTESQTDYYCDPSKNSGKIDYSVCVPVFFNDGAKTTTDFHTYEINYEPAKLEWWIDGHLVRTVVKNGTEPFPNQTGQLFLGIWDVCGLANGTVTWAHGPSEWCSGTNATAKAQDWTMEVDWVEASCYPGYEDTTPTKIVTKPAGSGTTGGGSSSTGGTSGGSSNGGGVGGGDGGGLTGSTWSGRSQRGGGVAAVRAPGGVVVAAMAAVWAVVGMAVLAVA
ncbi:hypothetical protein GGF32_009496 [Allomyces javanicus]|nr:hypothetical protein GGF32_009496 [Allomyces javanicus]